jgi:hypothetical protein
MSPSVRTRLATLATLAALLLGAGAPVAAQVAALDAPEPLEAEASDLLLHHGGKSMAGHQVKALSPALRRALNAWAGVARRLELVVCVPKDADVLVLGRAPLETLEQAATWADETWALFDKLRPVPAAADAAAGEAGAAPALPVAIVIALFDAEGFASPAWPGLLDELAARNLVLADTVTRMKAAPGSLMLRNSAFFTQHTYDMVGDVTAGDDEYRVGNEVAHKTAQLIVETRFGRQPDVLRWGVGYVAEQRLFGTTYQFNASGHVNATDHFGWPTRTRDGLAKVAKGKQFSLVETILKTPEPGTPHFGQLCAWSLLDQQLAKDSKAMGALLAQLGTLHRTADPTARSLDYEGEAKQVQQLCSSAWGGLKPSALMDHLKRLKAVSPPPDDGY